VIEELKGVPASISALKFDAVSVKRNQKRGDGVATIIGGKIVSLSIETKVAIAVATGFVLLVVGATAQGKEAGLRLLTFFVPP
jgi:hypothetical protein